MVFAIAPALMLVGAGLVLWAALNDMLVRLRLPGGTGGLPWLGAVGLALAVAGVTSWFSAANLVAEMDDVYAQGACSPFGGYLGVRVASMGAYPVRVGVGPFAMSLPRHEMFFCHDGTTVEVARSGLAKFTVLGITSASRPTLPPRPTSSTPSTAATR